MLELNVHGTQLEIAAYLASLAPEVGHVLEEIDATMTRRYHKREIRNHEAALLYVLAKQYNQPGAEIVEIGTCYGWSALVMAHAAPQAHIITCTPNPSHIEASRQNLAGYPNVELRGMRSTDLLAAYEGPDLDLIFVDGDHKIVRDDLPWWNWLKVDGLMIHHDYSQADAPYRPCRWVWDALNDLAAALHPFDVLIENEFHEGMAGWYRRDGEEWMPG
jgi:predicted O-methyltransferase YrrM